MRHPATLGAATRQWNHLVELAAAAGATVLEPADTPADTPTGTVLGTPASTLARTALSTPGSTAAAAAVAITVAPPAALGPLAKALPTLPPPGPVSDQPRHHEDSLQITVARPGVRRGQGPLTELGDRVDRLRHLAWANATPASTTCESGTPAIVLANLAAIGVALNSAAAQAHRRVAAGATGQTHAAHWRAAQEARAAELLWRDAADLVRCLRTPHPPTHPVQVERLDIHALLRRIPARSTGAEAARAAWALTRVAQAYADVAGYNEGSLTRTHEQGDLMLLGRAIPTEALPRRSDLLAARLSDRIVPAPVLVVDRLVATYQAIAAASDGEAKAAGAGAGGTGAVPEGGPPAA